MSSAWAPIEPVEPRSSRRRDTGSRVAALRPRRDPDVVPDDRGEQDRVKAVERAAVGPEHASGVLRAGLHALDEQLEQVAHRPGDRHAEAERGGGAEALTVDVRVEICE